VRGSTIVAIVVAVVLVLYFAYVSAETAETQRLQGPAVIALVQEQFEPSPKLQAMHPIGNFKWVATPNAVDCKFQRPQVKNCWEVYFGANVEGPDLDGRAPGKIEANFIVDGDTMRLVGRPQTGPGMFVRKGRPAVP
jgi:hypothetical protein